MIPELRRLFNERFSAEKYAEQCRMLAARSGCQIHFRPAETPLFVPAALARRAGELAEQLIVHSASPGMRTIGEQAIPRTYNIPGCNEKPLSSAVDFAITGSREHPELKLIELQGFPSLYYFQPLYSQVMRDIYELDPALTGMLYTDGSYDSYYSDLQDAIVGELDPASVILLELDPYQQKTLPDFLLTQQRLSIPIVNIRDLSSQKGKLYYPDASGNWIEVRRIYNRTIYDELQAKRVGVPVDLTQPLDVEWAGHPNWYYKISKILLPHLSSVSEAVPRGYLLSELPFSVSEIDLDQYVLKPLFSFAGSGVVVGPTREDLERVPDADRAGWMLQERVTYADVLHTPDGHGVKAELRVMLLWPDAAERPRAMHTLVRLTRGKMVGVDFNKGLDFVGSSCALVA